MGVESAVEWLQNQQLQFVTADSTPIYCHCTADSTMAVENQQFELQQNSSKMVIGSTDESTTN